MVDFCSGALHFRHFWRAAEGVNQFLILFYIFTISRGLTKIHICGCTTYSNFQSRLYNNEIVHGMRSCVTCVGVCECNKQIYCLFKIEDVLRTNSVRFSFHLMRIVFVHVQTISTSFLNRNSAPFFTIYLMHCDLVRDSFVVDLCVCGGYCLDSGLRCHCHRIVLSSAKIQYQMAFCMSHTHILDAKCEHMH